MNIVYATDENYAAICAVSMVSLLENNKSIEKIHIFLLADQLTDQSREKFEELAHSYGRMVSLIDAGEIIAKIQEKGFPPYREGYTTYIRLLLAEYLREEDKVLYLDCDTLVLGNLQQVYSVELDDCPGMAVIDNLNAACNLALKRKKSAPYFNAAVMIINLNFWRKDCALEQFLAAVQKINIFSTATVSDQDLINYVYGDTLKKLELKYNVTQPVYLYAPGNLLIMCSKKEKNYYTKCEIAAASKNPIILHFTGYENRRPWFSNCTDLELQWEWDEYLQKTPWKYYEKKENARNKWMRLSIKMYHILPENIYCVFKCMIAKYKLYKKRKDGM